ncbi:fibronectin-binding protein FnbA [Staphylococcus auricularis]|uniref:Fibrinogen-binding adhesin SdrG C-terminal domain-containing protein n=1 Tax=Staphylococcus auricularis TaxID=29379 RepID=A0AAW7MDA2_9STAP|nr:fibrinogen-binding adhesin SdrG C-terminal domain-containing protein [Staphylococcus auricularis]MDC6327090.1 fibrinogen-binding adhesin SdrG C-terminal domain-containing protein [Staphylococcus auricularis]MDN4533199.1 fibrinogen-binding adhesin SdrG C-terminal domain-containing protein [Staphylococcus auricularis]MDN4533299.1 fibrinogen-binding adhesin SdrG C-terminal domain-containing protein [Staphylococcus auricularis]
MHTDFTVDGQVNSGDYFTVELPKTLSAEGDGDYSKVNNTMNLSPLKNANGDVVALGTYNTIDKTIKYVFTDYVNGKKNVRGQFKLPVFTDRKNAPVSGRYEADFNVAGNTYEDEVELNYSTPFVSQPQPYGTGISSQITDIDDYSGQRTYKQSIYVNPMGKSLTNPTVTIRGFHKDPTTSSTIIDEDNTNLRIFRVKDRNKLADSYYVNPEDPNLEEVTDDFNDSIEFNNDTNSAKINFASTSESFVVLVDGHFDDSGHNVKTTVSENNTDMSGYTTSGYDWENENFVSNGSGSADGDEDGDADADADADADSDADADEEELPDTGNNNAQNGTLLGSLFAALGSLFLFGKRRKNNNEEK